MNHSARTPATTLCRVGPWEQRKFSFEVRKATITALASLPTIELTYHRQRAMRNLLLAPRLGLLRYWGGSVWTALLGHSDVR